MDIGRIFHTFARFFNLFPCPLCKEGDGNGCNDLCAECRRKIKFIDPAQRCRGCGGIKDGVLAVCSKCLAEKRRPWQDAAAIFHYFGKGKDLITAFKDGNAPEIAGTLGRLGAEVYRQSGICADVIVPIPLHFFRLLKRQYNQSELFARQLGGKINLPVVRGLRRISIGKKQAGLGRSARLRNARHRFRAVNIKSFANRRVLLVDDVFTTGATCDAAARVLLKAGAASVSVLCCARTPKHGEVR